VLKNLRGLWVARPGFAAARVAVHSATLRAISFTAANSGGAPGDTALSINLATALQLAGAKPFDIQIASRQVEFAARSLDRAKLLWVPNLVLGTDYFAHTGVQQNFAADTVKQNRNSFMAGAGPNVVFSVSDAIYAPLAARQDLRARQAQLQAMTNDIALAVAEAYFNVQQAPRRTGRGDAGGSKSSGRECSHRSTGRGSDSAVGSNAGAARRTRSPQASRVHRPRTLADRGGRTGPAIAARSLGDHRTRRTTLLAGHGDSRNQPRSTC